MPVTISKINSFVPVKDRYKAAYNNADNNVLYNISALRRILERFEDRDEMIKNARGHLNNVLNAADGKTKKDYGDESLALLHEKYLPYLYNISTSEASPIPDEEKEQVKELTQRIAYGIADEKELNKVAADYKIKPLMAAEINAVAMHGNFAVDAEKKAALKENLRNKINQAIGKDDEHKQDIQEQPQQAPEIAEDLTGEATAQSAWDTIVGIQREIGAMPKNGDDVAFLLERSKLEGAQKTEFINGKNEQIKKAEVEACLKIMATRRAGFVERNAKQTLQIRLSKSMRENALAELKKDTMLVDFLNGLTQEQRRYYIGKGHGGAMEDAYKEHVKNAQTISSQKVNEYYMPDAKTRTEILQKRIKSRAFSRAGARAQAAAYAELIATRAAVGSIRGDKNSLKETIDPKELDECRKELMEGASYQALINVAAKGDNMRDIAGYGHGGRLEDEVVNEVCRMGASAGYGYRLPIVSDRIAPTAGRRMSDIRIMLSTPDRRDNSPLRFRTVLTKEQKIEKLAEYSMLKELDPDTKMHNTLKFKRNLDTKIAAYKMMNLSDEQVNDFVAAAVQGEDQLKNAVSEYEESVKSRLAGNMKMAEVKKELADIKKTPDWETKMKGELIVLAAKKMVVDTQLAKPEDLYNVYEGFRGRNYMKNVKYLMADTAFVRMNEKLSAKRLAEVIENNGTALMDEYNKAKVLVSEEIKARKEAILKEREMAGKKPAGVVLPQNGNIGVEQLHHDDNVININAV